MANSRYQAIRVAEMVEAGLRAAKPYTCRKCEAQCLRGDDHDTCSMTATVDIEPVDQIGEALAIIDGLATFTIRPATGKTAKPGTFELNYRESWHYENHAHPVLVAHRCRKVAP